jgi:hypothetical protein
MIYESANRMWEYWVRVKKLETSLNMLPTSIRQRWVQSTSICFRNGRLKGRPDVRCYFSIAL